MSFCIERRVTVEDRNRWREANDRFEDRHNVETATLEDGYWNWRHGRECGIYSTADMWDVRRSRNIAHEEVLYLHNLLIRCRRRALRSNVSDSIAYNYCGYYTKY